MVLTPLTAMSNTRGVPLRESPQDNRHVRCCSQSGDGQITKKKIRLDGQMCGEENAQVPSKNNKALLEKNEKASFREVDAVTTRIFSKQDTGDEKIQEDNVNVFPHNFKEKIAEEIKRQVLDGLSEVGKASLQDLQVVDIEEMRKCTTANNKCTTVGVMKERENPGLQQYVAKVKLMASLFIPLTVQADQELQNTEVQRDQQEHQGLQEQCDEFEEAFELPTRNKGDELDVPNFVFYDFDSIRSENMFAKDQIWALYDDTDGMPRHYAQIRKIVSIIPFNVEIAWLGPNSDSAEARAWLESGNALTCGEYDTWELKESTMTHVECFSHVLKQEVGQGGKVRIYPSEGDVWALYKGWRESDWSQRIKLGYDIVKVATNNEESSEISVVPLVNFKGHRTVFIQKEMNQKPLSISKQDIIRFSHQIPMHKLVEDKVPEVLKGCLELDSASIPDMLFYDK